MMASLWFPRWLFTSAALLIFIVSLAAVGQTPPGNPNERSVKPERNVQDAGDIFSGDPKAPWVLHFSFRGPRLIMADVPGRGRRLCWYLWYQVTNYTSEPRTFIPDFELVTLDKDVTYHDQVLPKVQEAIQLIEDPTNRYKVKNSVTIAAEPIPPSLPHAAPRVVTGVAIWDDVDPDANRYSIFVRGLSNGWSETDPIPPDTEPVLRRKTLQLDFRRLGDRYYQRSEEIHFVPPYQWIYRAVSKRKTPGRPAPSSNRPGSTVGVGYRLISPFPSLEVAAKR